MSEAEAFRLSPWPAPADRLQAGDRRPRNMSAMRSLLLSGRQPPISKNPYLELHTRGRTPSTHVITWTRFRH